MKILIKGEIIWEIILNDSEVENLNGPISKKGKPRSYRIVMLQRAAGLGDWLVSEFFQVPKQFTIPTSYKRGWNTEKIKRCLIIKVINCHNSDIKSLQRQPTERKL